MISKMDRWIVVVKQCCLLTAELHVCVTLSLGCSKNPPASNRGQRFIYNNQDSGYSIVSLTSPSFQDENGFPLDLPVASSVGGLSEKVWRGLGDKKTSWKDPASVALEQAWWVMTLFTARLRLAAWIIGFCKTFRIPSIHFAALWTDTSAFIQINAAS